jgi:hypothetical protein
LFFIARAVADLAEKERWFTLGATDAATINPNSETCPVFLSRRDAELTKLVYQRFPVLRLEATDTRSVSSPWNAKLSTLFHMTADAGPLRTREALVHEGWTKSGREFVRDGARMLPIIEGKMATFYDHRAAHIRLNPDAPSRQQQSEDTTDQERSSPDFFPDAYLWAPGDESFKRFQSAASQPWAVAFKRVTSATNWRTLVACVVPNSLAISYTLYVLAVGEECRAEQHSLLATLNSFAYDYFVRQKTMQPSLPIGPVYETVIPPPESFAAKPAWAAEPLSRWIASRVGELVCVSSDLVEFARATLGRDAVFKWDPGRRELLQAELDAALFHHFGMSRLDVEHVLATFPKVRDYDQKQYGEFRTALTILAIFDEMTAAARSGHAYQTRVSPPPADMLVEYTSEVTKVIPLPQRPAGRPLPAVSPAAVIVPDLAFVGESAWTRSHTMERGEIQAAILAVLKANGAPVDRRQARLASLLCLEPHLLASMLDKTEQAHWARVVGGDAKKAANASIDATSQEWGRALSQLRGSQKLFEDLELNTWTLGNGTEVIDTSGWPEGRAGFVVNVLRRLQVSTQVDAIIVKLPTNVQQWLANAA